MEGSLSALFIDQHLAALSDQSKEELRQLLARARVELELARATAIAENSALESRSHCLVEELERVRRERDESNKQCRKMQEQLTNMSASSSSMPFSRDIPPLHSPSSGIGSEFAWRMSDICLDLPTHNNANPNSNPSQFHLDHSGFHLDQQDGDSLLPWPEEEREGNLECIVDDSRVLAMHLPEPLEADIEVMLKSLPEKGKLMQAVLDAGPLLEQLLLTGPLPKWKHPPPPLTTSSYFPALEHGFSFNYLNTRLQNRLDPESTTISQRFDKMH